MKILIFIMIFFALFLPSGNIFSQSPIPVENFHAPLDISLYLSGNFGDLRSDHFHSGVDIKTQGVSGLKVYSAADGYVSRIKIESAGYGKTLYIIHPNGYTTVYAHLDRFNPAIEQYVKKKQYEEKQHAVNLYPQKDEFHIKKGEVIAWSGNTGYSFGPHLHFEIRNTANQHPLNVLLYGFDIKDNIPPTINSVGIYTMDESSFINHSTNNKISVVSFDDGIYTIPDDQVIILSGMIGFGIEAFDYLNGSANKCGLYTVEMFIDSSFYYSWIMDEFSFNESRYINSLIDYGEKQRNNRTIQKAFIEPNNKLSLYRNCKNSGIVNFSDNGLHRITFIVKDTYSNTSRLDFQVRSQLADQVSERQENSDYAQLMHWETTNSFERDDIKIIIPAGALYKDLKFTYSKSERQDGLYSLIHDIHDIYSPLHIPCELSIKTEGIADSLQEKAIVVKSDKDGQWQYTGGEWNSGFVKARITEFGRYAVTIDTSPPAIKPLNFNGFSNIEKLNSLKFKVVDDLSGIKSYEGYIDNEWALFEYDAKNDLVFYLFDSERLAQYQNHQLELYIIDNMNNISFYYTEFIW